MSVFIFLCFILLLLHQCCTSCEEVCAGFFLLGGVCSVQYLLPRQLLHYRWVWGETMSSVDFDFYVWHVLVVTTSIFNTLFFFFSQAQPFWYRCVYILIWGKISLYKYVSCWVIAVSFLFDLQEYAWKLDCCEAWISRNELFTLITSVREAALLGCSWKKKIL